MTSNRRLTVPAASYGVAATLALTLAGCVQRQPPIVFILSGQSNMVGQGQSAELPDSLRVTPPNVRFFEDGSAAELAAGETFGPEVTLAHDVARRLPDREIILVKYAVGGTSLLAWAPDWDSARAALTDNSPVGPLYAQLLEHIADARLPRSAQYGAALWVQGERDARYPAAAAEYLDNLANLIERLRADVAVPDLPFLLARVNPPPRPGLEQVRRAQEQIANRLENVVTVDADGLSKRGDGVHYDTGGILELGRRFARAWLERYGSRNAPPVER